MPLHEWTDREGWDGVHHLWITELLRWIKPRLPEGYRAYIGVAPTLAVGAPTERPDVGVRKWNEEVQPAGAGPIASTSGTDVAEPDEEIAVATLDPGTAVFVEHQGRLVAAVELISPRNKDRVVARSTYVTRYLSYLLEGAHLLLIDVHRRPLEFSFADEIARELQISQPSLPPPYAISYRVGEPAASGGRILGIWRRPLTVGQPLPSLPLSITLEINIPIDLEATYARAASDAYLP
jgi:hypothetical protein